jgi:hypothetical protein
LIFLLGLRHPPPLNDISPLDAKRWAVGGVAVAVLVSAFVLVPITAPAGSYQFTASTPTLIAPPTGYNLSANVTTTISNQDFVAHGFGFSGVVTGAIVSINGTPTNLTGTQLSAYAANSTWYVHFPDGSVLTSYRNATVSLPTYATVPAGERFPLIVTYLNTETAIVTLQFTVSLVCSQNFPAPGTSSAYAKISLNS